MRKFYNFRMAILAIATMFVAVACEKDKPKVDEPDPEVEYIEPFEMEQSEDGMSIEISYDSKAEKYSYAAVVCSAEDADDVIKAEDPYAAICEMLEAKDVELSDIDDEFIFKGDAVVDLTAWEVEYESDYVIAAVAYNDKLERTSEVASLEFTTPAKPFIAPFEMEQSEDGMSIDIIYDSEAEPYKYAVVVSPAADAADILEAEDPYAAICEILDSKEADLSEVDDKFIFEGDAVVDLAAWEVEYESDYVIAAVAYDDELECTSEVASLEITTPVAPEPESFATVSVSDPTSEGFTVTVDINDYDGNYAIIPTTQEDIDEIGSIENYTKYYLADDVSYYGTDYSVVDNYYVFSGDYVFDTKEGWNLNSDVEFVAIVVGVEGDGTYAEITTDIVVSEPIRTLEDDGTSGGGGSLDYPTEIELSDVDFGSIEISNVTSSSFDYSITPADNEMSYLIFAFTDEEYTTTYPTDEDRIVAIYDMYAYLAPYYGYTFSEIIAGSSAPGPYEDVFEDMDANTKYHVVAFGIDLTTYQPMSAVEVESVTTLEEVAPTASLASVTLEDVTFNSATITVDAGDYNGYYHLYPIPTELADNPDIEVGYAGDYETAFSEAVTYLLNYGYAFDSSAAELEEYRYLFTGDLTIQLDEIIWMVEPETEYYLLAAGIDEKGKFTTTMLKSDKFTTGVAPEFDIDIEIGEIFDTGVEVTFTPNINTVYYYNDVVLKSEYDAGNVTVDSIIADNPYIEWYLNNGKLVWDPELMELEPGTEYCVVAFAYDADNAVATSDLFTESFKTTGVALPTLTMPTEVTIPDAEFGSIVLGEITASSAAYDVTPNADIVDYVCFYIPAEDYDKLGSDEAVVLSDFARYQGEVDDEYEANYRDAMEYYLKQGKSSRNETWLDPETEYVVYAYGMDAMTGLPTTKLVSQRFTTLAEEASAPVKAMVKPVVTRAKVDTRLVIREATSSKPQVVRLSGITAPSMESRTKMMQSAREVETQNIAMDRVAKNRFNKESISFVNRNYHKIVR